MHDDKLFDAFLKIDTPTVSNAVATYPGAETCLDLYDPWQDNWYTDQTIKCIYPELGPRMGYAVTCRFGLPEPSDQHTFLDVIDELEAMPGPTILVLEQDFPPAIAAKVGLLGEIMTTMMLTVGCVGCVSNGPSRDIDAIRKLGFQLLLTGVSAGHGDFAVKAVNKSVSVCSMDVAPGEIIHMDENGAVKFPADKLQAVYDNCEQILRDEAAQLDEIRSSANS